MTRPDRAADQREIDAEVPTARRTGVKGVRENGIASEQEEALIGECAVASPVFDASDGAVGAIGIVVPSGAWPVETSARDAVREAARSISRELGARSWPAHART